MHRQVFKSIIVVFGLVVGMGWLVLPTILMAQTTSPDDTPEITIELEAHTLTGAQRVTYTLWLQNNRDSPLEYHIKAYSNFSLGHLAYYWSPYNVSDTHYALSGGPLSRISLEPGIRQPFTIPVYIPSTAPHGQYNLTSVFVSTDPRETTELQLTTIVSKSTSVNLVGQYGATIVPTKMIKQGHYAYLATADSVYIVDVTQPTHPQIEGVYHLPNDAPKLMTENLSNSRPTKPNAIQALQIQGDYLYLINVNSLRVVDLTDPTKPTEVGRFTDMGWADNLVVQDEYAYILWDNCHEQFGRCSKRQLRIFDISSPTNPLEIGRYRLDERLMKSAIILAGEKPPRQPFVVINQRGYLLSKTALERLDLSDPTRPTKIETHYQPDFYANATAILAIENKPYLEHDGNLLDISIPDQPVLVETITTDYLRAQHLKQSDETIQDVLFVEEQAYLKTETGLKRLDLSDPTQSATAIETFGTLRPASKVAVLGDYAYVDGGADGLRVIDVTHSNSPVEVAHLTELTRTRAIRTHGQHLYLLEYDGLHVWHISNPETPREVGHYKLSKPGFDLEIGAGNLYLTDNGQLQRLDISTPASPRKVAYQDEFVTQFTVAEEHIYALTEEDRFMVLDSMSLEKISVTEPLFDRNTIAMRDHLQVVGQQAYLYYQIGGGRLPREGWHAFDLSDPTNVSIKKAYSPERTHEVVTAGNLVYLAENKGLRLVDISNPSQPTPIEFLGTRQPVKGVAVANGLIYTANGLGGLQILRYEASR